MRQMWIIPGAVLILVLGIGVGIGGSRGTEIIAGMIAPTPTATPTVTPQPQVVRRYPQINASGDLEEVTQWDNGTFSTVLQKTKTQLQTEAANATATATARIVNKSFQFTVPARNFNDERLHLDRGAIVSGSFSVSPGDVDFSVWGPSRQITSQSRVRGQYSFSWTADQTGDYVIRFDNSYSILTSKAVNLSYTIKPPY